MSYSDDKTEKVLHTLQKKIVKEFGQAYKDLSIIAKEYFDKLEIRDKKYKEGLLDGTIQPPPGKTIDQHYKEWRTAQIGRGERWEALRDDMARRVTDAQEHAAAYINDTTPGIYALNANYEAYRIEQVDPNAAFNLVDEQTVKRLIGNEKQTLPKRAIDVAKEQAWNNKKLQQSLLQGILMGKSVKKIAKDFDQVAQMGARAAVRAARTAVTGAQNAGRQETYERATEMGIEIEKEWISTHDTRTRDSHRMLDGIRVPYDKKFPNGLMYPGDMSVNLPSEIWNCRCTMGAVLPGITDDARRVTWIDENGNVQYGTRLKDAEEYEKWYNNKIAKQKPYTHADATHKAMMQKESASEPKAKAITVDDMNEKLQKAIYNYTDGQYAEYCRYSQYLNDKTRLANPEFFESKLLPNISEEQKAETVEIMNAINSHPVKTDKLYRIEQPRNDYIPVEGEVISMGIRSTSRVPNLYEQSINQALSGLEDYADRPNLIEYVFDNSKSLDISAHSAYKAQEEELICGKYRVKSVEVITEHKDAYTEEIEQHVKDIAENVSTFVSKKSGQERVRYYIDGKEYIETPEKFETKVIRDSVYHKEQKGHVIVHMEVVDD